MFADCIFERKMFLSNTAQYAVRVLLYMSENPERKYSAAELIQKLSISDKYLRRIMTSLAKEGFAASSHGRDGGYKFKKKINEISLADIVFAIEGRDKYQKCILGFEECDDSHPCKLHDTWLAERNSILTFLETTTLDKLDDIAAKQF